MEEKRESLEKGWEDYLKRLKQKISNKLVVVFGQPLVGKTTLAIELSKLFKKVYYFEIDTNLKEVSFPENVQRIPIPDYKFLLRNLKPDDFIQKAVPDTLIVVDSITTLASQFQEDKLFSPRKQLELANFYDIVFRKFSEMVRGSKEVTAIIISHEALKEFPDKIAPRMNLLALRHADLVLRVYRENGTRKVKIWEERNTNPKEVRFFIEV